MRKITRGLFALAFCAMASAPQAGAVTLFSTPLVPANGQVPVCSVTNVDTKPITLTVEVVDADGATVVPVANECPVAPATLAPRETCFLYAPINARVSCRVTSSSKKIRAALNLLNGTTAALEVQAPATR
jgi:hypothetical protein